MRNSLLLLISLFLFTACGSSALLIESKASPYYYFYDSSNIISEMDRWNAKAIIDYDSLTNKGSFLNDLKTYQITDRQIKVIRNNRNLGKIPKGFTPLVGFTKEHLNMRLYPTMDTIHRGNPLFDYNQYTSIPAFTPVVILHTSKDENFYFVAAPFIRGWIQAEKVRIYSYSAYTDIVALPRASILADNVTIGNTEYFMGDKVPYIQENKDNVTFLTPTGGYVTLPKGKNFAIGYATYSEKNIKNLLDSQLNKPYDWGGKMGFRDCSSYVRDIWSSFGADLPRSSGLQRIVGRRLIGKPNNEKEFYDVLKVAKPYKTLIFFKGHVMIYGGMENGDYIVYHSSWSLKNDKGDLVYNKKIVKQYLKKERFTNIWQRVIAVQEISPNISPALPHEPYISPLVPIANKIN